MIIIVFVVFDLLIAFILVFLPWPIVICHMGQMKKHAFLCFCIVLWLSRDAAGVRAPLTYDQFGLILYILLF